MRIPLTIIIPAKHETETIIPTLKSLATHVRTPHGIIVINVSDTKDKTANLVRRYAKTHPDVRLIRKIHPHGTFGMALSLGFHAVKSGAVVPFMADACDNPKDIDCMYATLLEGWDVVSASRYMHGGLKIGGPAIQSFFSYLVCASLHLFTGVPTSDISNAFKMYKTAIIKKIHIPPESGVEASMMILLQAYFSGARIKEIPTIWTGRTSGESKFKLFERAPRYLKIYLWALYTSFL
jgi:dolichol-phosphate mannosyltransferase